MTEEIKQDAPKDIKTSIFENFLRQYSALNSFVQSLPIDTNHKSIAIHHLYLGFLAGREGIALLDFSNLGKQEEQKTVN